PAPAEAVAPPPAAATPEGRVLVEGDVFRATLTGPDRQERPPGALPPGTYDLRVTLTNGTTIFRPAFVRMTAGQTVRVRCLAALENCRIEP
ncbi:MAG: hypothetical protein ABIO70_12960, partial [Pseudomonadota bacterium]